MITYIKFDKDETFEGYLRGVKLLAFYIGLMSITVIMRNQYIISGI